jgi:hypothetical protein
VHLPDSRLFGKRSAGGSQGLEGQLPSILERLLLEYLLNCHTRSGCKPNFTPRTLNGCANVSPRMQMLYNGQSNSRTTQGLSMPASNCSRS